MRRGLLGLSVLLVLAGCGEPEAPPSESARMLDQVVAQVKAAKTMHAKFRISASSQVDRALHSLDGDVDLVLRPGAVPDLTANFVEQDMHHADDVTDNDLIV